MARYFTTFANRGKAYVHAHKQVGVTGEATTLYVVAGCQPPMFLVGPPTHDMEIAGATALMTLVPGLPDGDVRQRNTELEDTVALLKDVNAGLQADLRTAKRHLNPPPCTDGDCANCEDVGFCCFCNVEVDHAP